MPRRIRKIIYHEDSVDLYHKNEWNLPEPEYIQYIGGQIVSLIPKSAKLIAELSQNVNIPLFNESNATDIPLNLGIEGMYYLKQRFNYTLSEIIAEPEGIAIDVITNEGCLFWIFYNMTESHQVLLTLRQKEDTENIARQIGKYCNDLKLRREVVSQALTKMNAVGISTVLMQPDYITVEELGPYTMKELGMLFGRGKRTMKYWFGGQNSKAVRPYERKGNANLYDASEILIFADKKGLRLRASEVISHRFSKIKMVKRKFSDGNQLKNTISKDEDVEKMVKNYIRQKLYSKNIVSVSEHAIGSGLSKYLDVRLENPDQKESYFLESAYHAAIDFYRKYDKQHIEYDDEIDYSIQGGKVKKNDPDKNY